MSFDQTLSQLASTLSDDELCAEYRCAERCALLATRSRRDLALLRLRCICRELERRQIASVKQSGSPITQSTLSQTG